MQYEIVQMYMLPIYFLLFIDFTYFCYFLFLTYFPLISHLFPTYFSIILLHFVTPISCYMRCPLAKIMAMDKLIALFMQLVNEDKLSDSQALAKKHGIMIPTVRKVRETPLPLCAATFAGTI